MLECGRAMGKGDLPELNGSWSSDGLCNGKLPETSSEVDGEWEIPWLAFLPPSNLFPVTLTR